jgi:surface antigen Omp85-like protein
MSKPLRAAMVFATLALVAPPLYAQQSEPEAGTYELPRGWITSPPRGIVPEPSILSKFAMSTDSALGAGPRDGWYVQTGSLITGAWISGGPGYRLTILDGRARVDASAVLSGNLYKSAQVSFQLPELAHGRLSLGTTVSYQDSLQVKYSGIGNDTPESDRSAYRFHNADVVGTGRLQANRWLSIDGRLGWIPRPTLSTSSGPTLRVPNTVDRFSEATAPGITHQPAFVHGDISIVADSRDHAGHPTSGGMYRVGASAYSDRDAGTYSFRRYEVEAAQFMPLGTRKLVLALRAWEVFSDTSAGNVVPFYLMPNLGGHNSLRSYYDYRFHDNDLQSFSAESRLALLTHMDVAVFADAGKVAVGASDLDFRHLKTSYGAGVRFHNATSTLLRLDAGHGAEGWRVFLKLSDSFRRTTPAWGRTAVVPFVP